MPPLRSSFPRHQGGKRRELLIVLALAAILCVGAIVLITRTADKADKDACEDTAEITGDSPEDC